MPARRETGTSSVTSRAGGVAVFFAPCTTLNVDSERDKRLFVKFSLCSKSKFPLTLCEEERVYCVCHKWSQFLLIQTKSSHSAFVGSTVPTAGRRGAATEDKDSVGGLQELCQGN